MNSIHRYPTTLAVACLALLLLPAVGQAANTVYGSVTITKRDGAPRQDHSNVILFIDHLEDHLQPPKKQRHIPLMSHKRQQFTPRVFPIVKGDKINFLNDDRIFHNVFSLSKIKTFDLGIYPQGTQKLVDFNQAGLVKVYCNIHPNMVSTILILNNPYFAKTGTDGRFEIAGLADGRYTLRLWHEFSDQQQRQITLKGGSQVRQDFAVMENKRLVQHKNKFGKRYKSKY